MPAAASIVWYTSEHARPNKPFSTQKRISFSVVHFIFHRPVISALCSSKVMVKWSYISKAAVVKYEYSGNV